MSVRRIAERSGAGLQIVSAAILGILANVNTWSVGELRAQQRSFERLSDGRVFVEIFGQQMALPGSEADLDQTNFHPFHAGQTNRPQFTLREALLEPHKAIAAFEKEERWVSVRIVTDYPPNRLVLGRFAPGTVPLSSAANPLVISVYREPRLNFVRGRLPDRWPPEAAVPDEGGYFVRPGIVGSNASQPMHTGYRLPGARRLWRTDVDLIVICSLTGASVRRCNQGLRTKDGRISIGWSWYEPKQPTAPTDPYAFPKSAWTELDLRLREVAEYLMLNRPAGEME